MELILIRHGKTAGNLRKAYIGATDEPLCPEGVAALQIVAPDLRQELVYVSSLQRTAQSANILFPNATLKAISDLNEMNFGVFEGKNWQDMSEDDAYSCWIASQCEASCPQGECAKGFKIRVNRAFCKLVDDALVADSARLVLVIHGGAIMSIASTYALPKKDFYDWSTGNGQRRRLVVNPDQWKRDRTINYAPTEDV